MKIEMNMKKNTLLMIALIPAIGWAQSGPYHLTGRLEKLTVPAIAYLAYRKDGKAVMDSVEVKDGKFSFDGTCDEPGAAEIALDHNGKGLKGLGMKPDTRVIYLQGANVSVNGLDSIKTAKISGPSLNSEYANYEKETLLAPQAAIDRISVDFKAASPEQKKDPEFKKTLDGRYEQALADRKALQSDYIKKHPDSYFSIVALSALAGNKLDPGFVEPIYNGLTARLRGTKQGIEMGKTILAAKNITIGKNAPDFTQNDVNDKPVKLSDFKGKYVLLDFWASWCGPCRAENPNVVKAYAAYKDKNFTVLSVSLDRPGAKDAWLDAIKADGLTWTNVSDLKFWDNDVVKQYGIRFIPANFLIDPTGKIVGRDLRGETLNKKLEELLSGKGSK